MNKAFSSEDRLFCLSIEEAVNHSYGFVCLDADGEYFNTDTRVATNTAYAAAGGSSGYQMNTANHAESWWLRSMGATTYYAASCGTSGSMEYGYYDSDYSHVAVRPALHLDLSKIDTWTKGDSVSAKHTYTKVVEIPVPSIAPVQTSVPSQTPMQIVPSSVPITTESQGVGTTNVTAPAKVVISSLTNKRAKKVVLKIKGIKGAKGYQIQYTTNKKFKKAKSVNTNKTAVIIKKLTKKKAYYFRVRAYKTNGTKKVYGIWSGVKKVKIKK